MLVISRFGFEGWVWVLIASVSDLCILFALKKWVQIATFCVYNLYFSQNISADLKELKVNYKLHHGRCTGRILRPETQPTDVLVTKPIITLILRTS